MDEATSIQNFDNLLKLVGQVKEEDLYNMWNTEFQKIETNYGHSQNWLQYKKEKAAYAKDQGNAGFTSGKTMEAILWFSFAILLDPSNFIFYSNRSAAWINAKNYSNALADANKCIHLNPNWARGYSRKGAACFFLKQYDEALNAYKQGLAIEPNNEILMKGMQDVKVKEEAAVANENAEQCIAKRKDPEAVQFLDKAVLLDPNEPLYRVNRSEANLNSGNYEQALKDADQAIQLAPNWFKGYKKRGDTLYRWRRYDEAASAYCIAVQLEPNNDNLKKEMNLAINEGVKARYVSKAEEERKKAEEEKKKSEDQKKKEEDKVQTELPKQSAI